MLFMSTFSFWVFCFSLSQWLREWYEMSGCNWGSGCFSPHFYQVLPRLHWSAVISVCTLRMVMFSWPVGPFVIMTLPCGCHSWLWNSPWHQQCLSLLCCPLRVGILRRCASLYHECSCKQPMVGVCCPIHFDGLHVGSRVLWRLVRLGLSSICPISSSAFPIFLFSF